MAAPATATSPATRRKIGASTVAMTLTRKLSTANTTARMGARAEAAWASCLKATVITVPRTWPIGPSSGIRFRRIGASPSPMARTRSRMGGRASSTPATMASNAGRRVGDDGAAEVEQGVAKRGRDRRQDGDCGHHREDGRGSARTPAPTALIGPSSPDSIPPSTGILPSTWAEVNAASPPPATMAAGPNCLIASVTRLIWSGLKPAISLAQLVSSAVTGATRRPSATPMASKTGPSTPPGSTALANALARS